MMSLTFPYHEFQIQILINPIVLTIFQNPENQRYFNVAKMRHTFLTDALTFTLYTPSHSRTWRTSENPRGQSCIKGLRGQNCPDLISSSANRTDGTSSATAPGT